jgi:hypothetical protein
MRENLTSGLTRGAGASLPLLYLGCAGKNTCQSWADRPGRKIRSRRRYVDIESIYKRNSKTTSNLLFIAHKKKQSAKPIAFCKMIEAYFKKLVVNDSFKFVDALVVGIPRTGMSAV